MTPPTTDDEKVAWEIAHDLGVCPKDVYGIYHSAECAWATNRILTALRAARDDQREKDTAETEKMRAFVESAKKYRFAESYGTPRMWRGKDLQDIANELDDAISQLQGIENGNTC